jgi:hypothetical protein
VDTEPPRRKGKRAPRVPYQRAVELVGPRALAEVATLHTVEFGWKELGVPAGELCWIMLAMIEMGKVTLPTYDSPAVGLLRDIAKRSGEKGPAWELVTQALNLAWRDLKRGGSR